MRSISSSEMRLPSPPSSAPTSVFRGPIEECLDEVSQGGPAGGVAGDRRHVDVPQAGLLVVTVSLALEHSQLRAHGGVVGLTGQVGHHLAGGGAAAAVEDVDDLPLAAAECGVQRAGHVLCE